MTTLTRRLLYMLFAFAPLVGCGDGGKQVIVIDDQTINLPEEQCDLSFENLGVGAWLSVKLRDREIPLNAASFEDDAITVTLNADVEGRSIELSDFPFEVWRGSVGYWPEDKQESALSISVVGLPDLQQIAPGDHFTIRGSFKIGQDLTLKPMASSQMDLDPATYPSIELASQVITFQCEATAHQVYYSGG